MRFYPLRPIRYTAAFVALSTLASSCAPRRISPDECRQMLSRYIDMTLSSEDAMPNLAPAQAKDLRETKIAARMLEPSYIRTQLQCEKEVSRSEFVCAMKAGNADEWEACIE